MKRKYSTLKLIYDKPVLSDNETDDFTVRRGVVSEYEDELHVCFSRSFIFKWLAIMLLIISMSFTSIPISIMALLSFSISQYYIVEYRKRMRCYKMSINMIDIVIQKKNGLILQPIF